MVHVALLRGVNVGGKNRLRMRDLEAMFVAAGADDVGTLIQSGNVIFSADAASAPTVASTVELAIAGRYGFRTTIVTRTADEMAQVVAGNPSLLDGTHEDYLHVLFLAERPSELRVATLDPDRSAPDAFAYQNSEIYLRLPNGAAKTKLTATYFDSRLKTVCTGRNWRTVNSLLDLMQG